MSPRSNNNPAVAAAVKAAAATPFTANAGEAARTIGNVIRCRNVVSGDGGRPESFADFTIVLGRDFDGRFCAD